MRLTGQWTQLPGTNALELQRAENTHLRKHGKSEKQLKFDKIIGVPYFPFKTSLVWNSFRISDQEKPQNGQMFV